MYDGWHSSHHPKEDNGEFRNFNVRGTDNNSSSAGRSHLGCYDAVQEEEMTEETKRYYYWLVCYDDGKEYE